MARDDLARQAGKDGRLAPIPRLVTAAEPVPAGLGVVAARLMRVDNHKPMLLGQGVHAGPGGKILRGLGAAVKHHHKAGDPLPCRGWDVGAVAARSGGAGETILGELCAVRKIVGRRGGPAVGV